MFHTLKMLFKSFFEKTETNTFTDTVLGKLTCEFTADSEYFFWDGEITMLNKNGEETMLSIDGSRTSPDVKGVENARWAVTSIEMIMDLAQQEVTKAYPDKAYDLRRDFNVQDISTYVFDDDPADDEANLEVEFCSPKLGTFIISFKDRNFIELDYFE